MLRTLWAFLRTLDAIDLFRDKLLSSVSSVFDDIFAVAADRERRDPPIIAVLENSRSTRCGTRLDVPRPTMGMR